MASQFRYETGTLIFTLEGPLPIPTKCWWDRIPGRVSLPNISIFIQALIPSTSVPTYMSADRDLFPTYIWYWYRVSFLPACFPQEQLQGLTVLWLRRGTIKARHAVMVLEYLSLTRFRIDLNLISRVTLSQHRQTALFYPPLTSSDSFRKPPVTLFRERFIYPELSPADLVNT